MFSKRLIAMVPSARQCIAGSVALQWVALLANVALFMAIGWFLQLLLEGSADARSGVTMAVIAVMGIAVRFACQTAAQRLGQRAASAAKAAIRQDVYQKLVRLGPSYRETISTGEALQMSVEGVEHLESYFGSYLPQPFYSALAPLTLFACLAPISPPTAAALLACVPLIPLSIVAVQRIAKRVMGRYWSSYTDLGSLFLESIQGLTTLKVFQADGRRHEVMNREAESFRKATMRLLVMQLNSITVMDLFAFGGAAAGIVMALFQFSAGAATFAGVFAIVFLSAEFFLPLRSLGSFFHTAMSGMAAAEKIFELLDVPEPRGGSLEVDPTRADIECRGVSYSYDGKRTVLADVDTFIPQGSFVGIAGESGSGKSTLAGILCGSLGRYEGEVRIGGTDVRELSRTSLRRTLTYVPFASHLFEGTVRSNLRMAAPEASDTDLWEALHRCQLDGFVRASGGLDAQVAPEGSNLSGGQRQRLAMARALLHDTPIYVLDEATSNIDSESEAAIIALVQNLATSKTVVMVTHRLAALKDADGIYVLEDGRVAEAGRHDELASAGGVYGRMWQKQAHLEAFADQAGCVGVSLEETDGADDAGAAAVGRPDTHNAGGRGPGCPRRSHLSVMARLVGLTKPLLPVMAAAVALGVLGFGAAIFLTVFAVYGLLDLAGVPQGVGWGSAVAAVIACGVLRGPLRYGEQLCNHYLAFKVLALVRDRLFVVMRTLAPAKLEGRDKGNLVSLMTADVELLEVFYAHTLSPAAIAVVVSTAMVAFIAFQSPVLAAWAAFSYLVMGVAVPWVSSKASGDSGREVRDGVGTMNAFVLDSLGGLPEIMQFGREGERLDGLRSLTAKLQCAEGPLKRRGAVSMAATGLLVMALGLGMLAIAAMLVGDGQLSFGPAVVSVAALMSSFGPVVAVAALGTSLQQTLAAGARVLEVLDERPIVPETLNGEPLGSFEGAMLHGVGFSYGDEHVLDDVDLKIEKGSIVRIAGRSGADKSTLLKLLMRFWDADTGRVEVSGRDIRGVDASDLRRAESFMAQDTFLFTGTIRDNLLVARPQATDAELHEALEKVSLTDLVDRLPYGIDTPVGDLGDALSGGERQRLGLARVLLHDAPFVLLDEPTSNLDSLNEAAVLKALAENRKGKTMMLVSHRPSAAAIADTAYSVERMRRAS